MNKYIDQSINAISDCSYSAEVDYTENQFKTLPHEYNMENDNTAHSKSGVVKGQVNAMISMLMFALPKAITNKDFGYSLLKFKTSICFK